MVVTRFQRWIDGHGRGILWASLASLALGLIYWRVMRGYIPTAPDVAWPAPPGWVASLYTARWVVRGVLVAAGLALAYLEWRLAAVSALLHNALTRRGSTGLLIGSLTALLGSYIFQPGNYYMADYRSTVSMPWAILQLLREGNLPVIWTTYVHMGSPFMQLHNSIYYYATGLLGLLVPDFFEATEISYFLMFFGSAYLMYAYVAELTESPLAGFVATIAWSGSFYRLQQIALGANAPLSAIIALWPLQFYFIERVLKSSRTVDVRRLSLVTLAVGAQIWIHALHGAWMVPLGLMYAGLRVLSEPQSTFRRKAAQLLGFAVAHVGAAVIGAYLLVPDVLESKLIPAVVRDGGVGLENLLDFAHLWEGGFISYSILALAGLGAVLVFVRRYRRAYAIAAQAIFLVLLMLAPRYAPVVNDILALIPLGNLIYARGSARYLLVAFGPITALVGVFALLLPGWLQRFSRLRDWAMSNAGALPLRVAVLSITLILIENVPLTLKANYKSPDSWLVDSKGRWPLIATLAQTADRTSRVLDMGEGLGPSFLYPMLTGHPSLSGNDQERPDSFQTSERMVARLRSDLKRSLISSDAYALLYQLNIGYLITEGADLQLADLQLLQRSDYASLWRVPYHSPIAATAAPSANFEVAVTVPRGGDVPVTIVRWTEAAATVALDFSLPQRAFVQVSYSAYPYQRVVLDGQTIQAAATPLGFIGFWADQGPHSLAILPEFSPWRKIMLPTSLAALALVIGLGVWDRRKR